MQAEIDRLRKLIDEWVMMPIASHRDCTCLKCKRLMDEVLNGPEAAADAEKGEEP